MANGIRPEDARLLRTMSPHEASIGAAGGQDVIDAKKARILREGARVNPKSLEGIRSARRDATNLAATRAGEAAEAQRLKRVEEEKALKAIGPTITAGGKVAVANIKEGGLNKRLDKKHTFLSGESKSAHERAVARARLQDRFDRGLQTQKDIQEMNRLNTTLQADAVNLQAELNAARETKNQDAVEALQELLGKVAIEQIRAGADLFSGGLVRGGINAGEAIGAGEPALNTEAIAIEAPQGAVPELDIDAEDATPPIGFSQTVGTTEGTAEQTTAAGPEGVATQVDTATPAGIESTTVGVEAGDLTGTGPVTPETSDRIRATIARLREEGKNSLADAMQARLKARGTTLDQ